MTNSEPAALEFRILGPLEVRTCQTLLGHVALSRDQFRLAHSLFERSLELSKEFAADVVVAVAHHNLGSVAFGEGDLGRAEAEYLAALGIYRGAANDYGVALCDLYLGFVDIEAGRLDDAAGHLAEALPVFRELGFLQYAAQSVDGIAAVLHARGETAEAVRLLSAASAIRKRIGEAPTVAARVRDRSVESARATLGEPAFAAAWAEGRSMDENEALDRAERAVAG